MRRQEEEALRQLEQALERLEQTLPEDADPEEEIQEWDDDFCEDMDADDFTGFTPYDGDLDSDDYDEEVYPSGRSSRLVPALVTVLALSVLTAMVLWLLQYLEVLG